MARITKIVDSSPSMGRVRDSSTPLRRIDAKRVAAALGARPRHGASRSATGPLSFVALAEELGRQLTSTGGRPGLAKAEQRRKIPLQRGDWKRLERIAAGLEGKGVHATPSQVASVLLHTQLEQVKAKSGRDRESLVAAFEQASRGR